MKGEIVLRATVTSVGFRIGGYAIRARLTGECRADFEVFSVVGIDEQGAFYQRKGASSPLANPAHELDDAETIARGSVKWDGCTDFVIQEGADATAHTCSVAGFRELIEAVAEAHELAASLFAADAPVNQGYAKL